MAISTYMTYLMHKPSTNYVKLVDIVDFPGLRDSPNMLDTTTLSNGNYTSIPGIAGSSDGLQFTANYDAATFQTLKGMEGVEKDFAVWIGANSSGVPTGEQGRFVFKGYLHVGLNGAGVNEVQRMTITIGPSTDITFAIGATGATT